MSGLVILGGILVVYALLASRLDRLSITAPMVFVVAGLILGPKAADLLPAALDGETGRVIVELTLAILLFADASTVRLRDAETDSTLPIRLLFIGLPLTIAAGTLLARVLFPHTPFASVALVATILAPTDASLGLAVFTNPAVPVRIRRALNLESGLNDGLATPFITLFVAMLVSEEHVGTRDWLVEASKEVALAILTGVVVGVIAGWLLRRAHRRGWTSHTSEEIAILALALLFYGGSVAVGGNGFVAAFVGGVAFANASRRELSGAVGFTETLGLFASFLVWALFGALLAGPVLSAHVEALPILYAVLSLTVVRMVPVALALTGTRLRRDTVAFMGWFGPRGLASVVFTLIAVDSLGTAGYATDPLVTIAVWTILLSVVAHGVSAGPLSKAYGRRLAGLTGIPELAGAPEPRIRRRTLTP